LLSCIYLQPIKWSEFEAAHCRKVGIRGGALLLVKIKSLPSSNSDRLTILHISATYKMVGI